MSLGVEVRQLYSQEINRVCLGSYLINLKIARDKNISEVAISRYIWSNNGRYDCSRTQTNSIYLCELDSNSQR